MGAPEDSLFWNNPQNKLLCADSILRQLGSKLDLPLTEMLNNSYTSSTQVGHNEVSLGVQALLQQNSGSNSNNLSSLKLAYKKEELTTTQGPERRRVSERSVPWLDRASRRFWDVT